MFSHMLVFNKKNLNMKVNHPWFRFNCFLIPRRCSSWSLQWIGILVIFLTDWGIGFARIRNVPSHTKKKSVGVLLWFQLWLQNKKCIPCPRKELVAFSFDMQTSTGRGPVSCKRRWLIWLPQKIQSWFPTLWGSKKVFGLKNTSRTAASPTSWTIGRRFPGAPGWPKCSKRP